MRRGWRTSLALIAGLVSTTVIMALPSPALADAAVDLEVDPTAPMVGEAIHVRYVVRIRNETHTQVEPLNIGPLEPMSDMSPPQIPMMFGGAFAMSIDTEREYIMRANAPGRYTIGNARVVSSTDGHVIAQHPPVTIVVGGTATGTATDDENDAGKSDAALGNEPVQAPLDPDEPPNGDLTGAEFNTNGFLRVGVDNPNPYVGQQIVLRLWLYVTSSDSNCELTDEPTMAGFWNETLIVPTRDRNSHWWTRAVAGRYMAIALVRKVALFPTQSGPLTIGPATASVEALVGGMFPTISRFQVRSPELRVDVRDTPAAGRPADYIPGTIGPVTLTAAADRTDIAVGETVTVVVRAVSEGSLASAAISPPANIDGIRVRAGGSRGSHDPSGGRVESRTETEFLVVPDRPGRFDLGSARLAYFDPVHERYDVAQVALPVIQAHGDPLLPDTRGQPADPQIDLRPLLATPVLAAHHAWFTRGAVPIASISAAPLVFALGTAGARLSRVVSTRRKRRADERRSDPRTMAAHARKLLATDPPAAISAAGRALDRALARVAAEIDGGVGALPPELRARVTDARQICDSARFAGSDARADDVVRAVESAVAALEDVA